MTSSIPVSETPTCAAVSILLSCLFDGLFLLDLLLRKEMMNDMLRRNPSVADDRHQIFEGIAMVLGQDAVHLL